MSWLDSLGSGLAGFATGIGDFIGLDGTFGGFNTNNTNSYNLGNIGTSFSNLLGTGTNVDDRMTSANNLLNNTNNSATGSNYAWLGNVATAAIPATAQYYLGSQANDIAQQQADIAAKYYGLAESEYNANTEKEKQAQAALDAGWSSAYPTTTTATA